MASKRLRKPMTPEARAALHADLRVRLELQHEMAEHTKPVLELEYGVDTTTIWQIETGVLQGREKSRVPDSVVADILRRRKIWRLTKERLQDYWVTVLAERYGISVMSVYRHVWAVREELRQVQTEFREAA